MQQKSVLSHSLKIVKPGNNSSLCRLVAEDDDINMDKVLPEGTHNNNMGEKA